MLFALMHIIHLLAVIIWIGGLAFITMLVLPMIIKMPEPLQKVLFFQRIERKFAPLARVYNLIVGISGFVMIFTAGWHRMMFSREGILILVMTVVWFFWAVMLFGLEPVIIKKLLERLSKSGQPMEIETIFARMQKLHWVLLAISLVAVTAGAAFAHGFL